MSPRDRVRTEQLTQLGFIDPELWETFELWWRRTTGGKALDPESLFWPLLNNLFIALEAADIDGMTMATAAMRAYLGESVSS